MHVFHPIGKNTGMMKSKNLKEERNMDKETLRHLIDVAAGREPADLCIRNAMIVDVFQKNTFSGNVYVTDGLIAGFGDSSFPPAKEEFDAQGAYLVPGLIDSHVHIESSHVTIPNYARLTVPCGTTTVIADPHEICNVKGLEAFDYMVKSAELTDLQVFIQLPSCIPTTDFDQGNAVLDAKELSKRIGNAHVLGLGELMNYPGTIHADESILDKLILFRNAGKKIDGHSPGIIGHELDAYLASGVSTEHEATSPEELRERVRRGCYVMLREGSASHDLAKLLPGVTVENSQYCMMCSDDLQPSDIVLRGHIDHNIRLAVLNGIDPIIAICMATINAANCYHLDDRGAIAPGRRADFLLVRELHHFRPSHVFIGGKLCAKDGRYLHETKSADPSALIHTIHVKDFSESKLALPLHSSRVRTISVIPHCLVTEEKHAIINRDEQGRWIRGSQDIIKLAVVERHKETGKVSLGLLSDFGLCGGAIALSISHDSHNIICAGDNDEDMSLAIEFLIQMEGGIVLTSGRHVIGFLRHEIAGLMTDQPGELVAASLKELSELAYSALHVHPWVDPFMTLCFMALPVIPEIKLTANGLYDVKHRRFVPSEV